MNIDCGGKFESFNCKPQSAPIGHNCIDRLEKALQGGAMSFCELAEAVFPVTDYPEAWEPLQGMLPAHIALSAASKSIGCIEQGTGLTRKVRLP